MQDLRNGMLCWDSGIVGGCVSSSHRYGGPAVKSRKRIYWQVCLRDNENNWGKWSEPAFFRAWTSLQRRLDAQWIGFPAGWSGRALLFRVAFKSPDIWKQVRIYLSGPGWSEVWINGQKIGGDAVLQPAQTDFSRSIHYLTMDVTDALVTGDNILAIHTGAGWYGTPVIRYRVEADGKMLTRSHVFSLPFVGPSPILRNSIYGGEEYDARLAPDPVWKFPGASPFMRNPMRVSGPAGIPRGFEEEPIRPQEELPVRKWIRLENGPLHG